MPKAAKQLMSLDEFLAWEREQPECYEYAGGVATMMTGGSLGVSRRYEDDREETDTLSGSGSSKP